MSDLSLNEMHCEPVSEGTQPLESGEVIDYMNELPVDWRVYLSRRIVKEFKFENFKRGMAFAQEIAMIAEEEQHHPDVCVSYEKVEVELSTHMVGGLTRNDFIMAAKIEQI